MLVSVNVKTTTNIDPNVRDDDDHAIIVT